MRRNAGVVIGIVKSLDDPDGEGRIELEFPWLPDGPHSAWAPIAVPLSGGQRGMFFMPEPGDEALVAFEQGDFNHPFIVGFLWNGVDRPPESDPKNRIILTPGGHTLRFEDGDNAKKIVIKSSSGHEIILDDTAAGQTIIVRTNGNQSVVLDDKDSSIQLQGGGRILALRGGQVQIS
jgi:uncharacterized protein involved in type VI secretion and phage assembly